MRTRWVSRTRNFRIFTAATLALWLASNSVPYSTAESRVLYRSSHSEVTPVQTSRPARSSNGCPIAGVVERGSADCDTALYEDSPTVGTDCRIPLILIHGIHGNRWPKNSGANSGKDEPRTAPYTGYFPSLISKLKSKVPGFDAKYKIYRFHYRSDVHPVKEIARSLRNRLDDLIRGDSENFDKKFLIIAHSMGGLVARSYMNDFDHDAGVYRGKRAGERISKLITLGTPHHGTQVANGDARAPLLNPIWGKLLSGLDQIKWVTDGCLWCTTDLQHPNRADLLWDNFDGSWSTRLRYVLSLSEKNSLLKNISHRYDNLVYPYWGSIDDGWMVNILGKEDLSGLLTFLWVQYRSGYESQLQENVGIILHRIINADFKGNITSISNDGMVPDNSARFDGHSDPAKQVHCFRTNHQQLQWASATKCERGGTQKSLADFLAEDLGQEPSATCPKPVVSTSLKLSTGAAYKVGQPISGTFNIANRGTGDLFMKRVVIGGRLAGTCPNNQCPDFGPVPGNITLAPNQSYSYSGSFTPSLAGNYTFAVAYENADGKWTMPVEAENYNVNRLNVTVQAVINRVVVSKSLTVAPNASPYPLGQRLSGTFSITNRGNTNVLMRQVLIGGRLNDTCPNNICPDFLPIPANITLAPGQTYNYAGQIGLDRAGTYTFYVAYQTQDGKWEIPVKPENGTINKLSLAVQPPGPTLTRISPSSVAISVNPQTIELYGTRLTNVVYGELRLPNGSITYLYIPLRQLFKVSDAQVRISAKFLSRGTYYVTVWSLDGKSNRYPIVVY